MHTQGKGHLPNHLECEIWALQTLQDWGYAPQLLYHNIPNRTVVMEDVGDTIETRTDGPSVDIPVERRREIEAWAEERCQELQEKYGLYHNDVYLRNITKHSSTGKLYLVMLVTHTSLTCT